MAEWTPAAVAAVAGAATGLLGSAGAAAAWLLSQPRRIIGDQRATIDRLRLELQATVADLDAERGKRRDLEAGTAALHREIRRLRERDGVLGRAADRWSRVNGLGPVLDRIHQGIVASTVENRGTLVWCNIAFCARLGYTRDQVLALNWRGLVAPEDLAATQAAEGGAHYEPVEGHVNRFRRAQGGWVQLCWYSTEYEGGVAWSVVDFERVIEE